MAKVDPRYYLAFLRIMVGYHFLAVGWPKLTGAFLGSEQLAGRLANIAADPVGLHRAFITEVVVPNAVLFSYVVALGEVAIGLSFVSGCLVRVSGLFASFHNLNIYLAIAYANGGAQLHLNRLYVVLHLVFVLTAAGRVLGVDGWLKRRYPDTWVF